MFLAINEIRHERLRYALVVLVVLLISYLVFFLAGLSNGLAHENRSAIDSWNADEVVLSDDSNGTLAMSSLDSSQISQIKAQSKAVLSQRSAVVETDADGSGSDGNTSKIDASLLGISRDGFLAPAVSQGRMFSSEGEVVVDLTFASRYGVRLGDRLDVARSDGGKLKVVGFTRDAQLSVAPVVYMSSATFDGLFSSSTVTSSGAGASSGTVSSNSTVNAVVVRGTVSHAPSDVSVSSISDFINDLPGYRAQVLTFGLMIGFLIAIAAMVVGVFIYVLTLQKRAVFGVMKAQGISDGFLGRSIVAQTMILSLTGVLVGALATWGTSAVLPDAVPYRTDAMLVSLSGALLVVSALAAALFSVRVISRIDPVEAIG
ncbi:ABC transporter permease [uncultured Bifidobacterium sp.]|uniref:ABC transporter permease n=1 Tax=uncultured Bifidobacterium sp. TaxID=165187 RepID=UPI00260991F6|nr:ABC transporter permease [uncultured Bifidobacterium sp.]